MLKHTFTKRIKDKTDQNNNEKTIQKGPIKEKK